MVHMGGGFSMHVRNAGDYATVPDRRTAWRASFECSVKSSPRVDMRERPYTCFKFTSWGRVSLECKMYSKGHCARTNIKVKQDSQLLYPNRCFDSHTWRLATTQGLLLSWCVRLDTLSVHTLLALPGILLVLDYIATSKAQGFRR